MPVEALNAEWRCPKCKGVLTHKSFGYKEIDGEWRKTRWVGEDGQWIGDKPIGGFELGSWFVIDTIPARPF